MRTAYPSLPPPSTHNPCRLASSALPAAGDGAGVGKGRQISGIILDNYVRGRRKSVWVSTSTDLYADAVRDLRDLGSHIEVRGEHGSARRAGRGRAVARCALLGSSAHALEDASSLASQILTPSCDTGYVQLRPRPCSSSLPTVVPAAPGLLQVIQNAQALDKTTTTPQEGCLFM